MKSRTEQPVNTRDKKLKNSHQQIAQLLHSVSTVNIPLCSPDHCSIPGAQTTGTTASANIPIGQQTLAHALPADLYTAIKESAQKGFLYTFLCTLDEEFLTAYLKKKNYSPGQIYWINKSVKALTLISLGAAFGRTLSTPFLNVLIASSTGFHESYAGYITSAGFLAYDLLTTHTLAAAPSFTTTTLSYGASLVAGLLGSAAARLTYKYGNQLAQNGIFSAQKDVVLQMEEIPEYTPAITSKRRKSC